MPEILCQYPNCAFVATNDSEAIVLIISNSNLISHQGATATLRNEPQMKQKLPLIPRPIVKQAIDDKEWATFLDKWLPFKRCISIPRGSLADQLFQCCERELDQLIIKENPVVIEECEYALLEEIEKMAVIRGVVDKKMQTRKQLILCNTKV